MNTIEDAWKWYQAINTQLLRGRRLAAKYWDDLPWEGRLGRDDLFRTYNAESLCKEAELGIEHLNDLAILVLFSMFEAQVREAVYTQVEEEAKPLQHLALRRAAVETLQAIAEGSFFRVLEPFKTLDAALIEQVNQVRRSRNWVAHGRRGIAPTELDPQEALRRLRLFLDNLDISVASS
jgi:hypothetical protein